MNTHQVKHTLCYAKTKQWNGGYMYACGGYQDNIMEYEQVMEVFAEANRALMNDTQPSTQQEVLLLQDCMWNGLTQIKTNRPLNLQVP